MAKETSPAPKVASTSHPKLPKLPDTHRIQKRPLLHPPIASPRTSASTQKVIYISARSPFIATIKRLRKFLSHIESRATGTVSFDKRSGKSVYRQIEDSVAASSAKAAKGKGEEVLLKATGKAIERLLHVAVWAQEQEGLKVRFETGSVGAVDDVVVTGEGVDEEDGSRVRRTSCLEVWVGLG